MSTLEQKAKTSGQISQELRSQLKTYVSSGIPFQVESEEEHQKRIDHHIAERKWVPLDEAKMEIEGVQEKVYAQWKKACNHCQLVVETIKTLKEEKTEVV